MSANYTLYITDLSTFPNFVNFTLARLSSMIPACLWFIAFYLFKDEEKIPSHIWLLISTYLIARGAGIFLIQQNFVSFTFTMYIISAVIPLIIMIGLSFHAIYIALSGYKTDLIENRRKLRLYFIIAASFLIIITRLIGSGSAYYAMYLGSWTGTIASGPLNTLVVTLALAFSLTLFIFGFNINSQFKYVLENHSTKLPIADVSKRRVLKSDNKLIDKIEQKLIVEKLYQKPGLTVEQFANEIGVHRNKLRKLITNYYGVKNFNQFLNQYRLKQVVHELQSTDNLISTIAYNSGFSSLSVFNTLFKSKFGVTPNEFRNQLLVFKEINQQNSEMSSSESGK